MYVASQLVGAMSGQIWARPIDETVTEIGFTLPRHGATFALQLDRDRPSQPNAVDGGSA